MTRRWIRERKRDYYHRKAKEENYRSRASYKLLQALEKQPFIKRGDVVVDLGAAPGGWLQVCQKVVGKDGFAIGVDKIEIDPLETDRVQTVVSNIEDPKTVKHVKYSLPRPADVVLSDVSPKVSGIWEVDHARQVALARKSMMLASELLRAKGNFFVKVFQGDMFNDFVAEMRRHFRRVMIIKPKASRPKSAEVFVLGLGLENSPRDDINHY